MVVTLGWGGVDCLTSSRSSSGLRQDFVPFIFCKPTKFTLFKLNKIKNKLIRKMCIFLFTLHNCIKMHGTKKKHKI